MRKRQVPEEQGALFGGSEPVRRKKQDKATEATTTWRMPEVGGRTIAEIRIEWRKRLSSGQATRVEGELNNFVMRLNKLGFGAVHVARSFVRRRKD